MRKEFTYIGFCMTAMMFAWLLVNSNVYYFLYDYFAIESDNLTNIIVYCIIFPIMLLLLSKGRSKPLPEAKLGIGAILAALCATFALAFISEYPSLYLADVLSTVKDAAVEDPIQTVYYGTENLLDLFASIVVAPVLEELLFRKFLIEKTWEYGKWHAVIFSALCFALYHMNIFQLFYTFSVGLILGFIFAKTGNILYTMLIHALFNLNGCYSLIFPEEMPVLDNIYAILYMIMLGIGVITIIVAIIKKWLKLNGSFYLASMRAKFVDTYINLGVIAFVITSIVMIIIFA